MATPKNNVGLKHPKMLASRWKPGQSGNPKGMGKRERFEDAVNRILAQTVGKTDMTKLEELAVVFVKEMTNGNASLFREFLMREWPATTVVEAKITNEVAFMAPDEYEDPAEWEEKTKTLQ